jgi:hypothetical protein
MAHALPIIFLALLAIELYGAIKHGDGYFHILFGAIVIGVGVVLILLLLNYVRFAIWPTAKQAAALVILSALSAIFLGQWLGHSVLETSEFDQDVHMKTETLTGVKLIGVMSRNTIHLKDGIIHVVPTADVIEFRTAGKR